MQLKNPGFTAVAVLTLALGIGANTAIFSIVDAVFLKSLPFRNPDRLVLLFEGAQGSPGPVAYLNYLDWKRMSRSFEDMACYRIGRTVVLDGAAPEKVSCKWVSGSFFSTLGVVSALGRTFTAADDSLEADPVVILDDSFWQQRFGGSPGVIGQSLNVEGKSYTIIGVLSAGFRFRGDAQVFLPIHPLAYQEARYEHSALTVLARLGPGVALSEAQTEMHVVSRRLEQEFPKENKGDVAGVVRLDEWVTGYARSLAILFFGAVGFVLLIACVNVASLLLARLNERHRELAIRTALGADRGRLVRQTLVESLLLAFEGGVLGVFLAQGVLHNLTTFVPAEVIGGVTIDLRVLLFTLLLCCGTAVLFGLVPAWKTAGADLNELLKEGERSGTGVSHGRFRDGLVIGEIALALVLLVGAGLMIRSAVRLAQVDPGFDPENVVTMRVEPPDARFFGLARTPDGIDFQKLVRAVGSYTTGLLARVRPLPGVEDVATVFPLPMIGDTASFEVAPEGMPEPASGKYPSVCRYSITGGYFHVMGIPIRKGRTFSDSDDLDAPRVAIVNETMAARFWPGEDPVGRRFRLVNFEDQVFTVVGLVADTRHDGLQTPPPPQLYLSQLQWPGSFMLVIKTPLGPEQMAAALRPEMAKFDPEAPVYDVRSLEGRLDDSLSHRRRITVLLGIFAALSLVLAAVGIYGVMAHGVLQRTREMGLRIALGAPPGQIVRMVIGRGMFLTLVGAVVGILVSLAVTRMLGSRLYGITPSDPVTYAGIAVLIFAVAVISTYLPARRAASVDPMAILRCE